MVWWACLWVYAAVSLQAYLWNCMHDVCYSFYFSCVLVQTSSGVFALSNIVCIIFCNIYRRNCLLISRDGIQYTCLLRTSRKDGLRKMLPTLFPRPVRSDATAVRSWDPSNPSRAGDAKTDDAGYFRALGFRFCRGTVSRRRRKCPVRSPGTRCMRLVHNPVLDN